MRAWWLEKEVRGRAPGGVFWKWSSQLWLVGVMRRQKIRVSLESGAHMAKRRMVLFTKSRLEKVQGKIFMGITESLFNLCQV